MRSRREEPSLCDPPRAADAVAGTARNGARRRGAPDADRAVTVYRTTPLRLPEGAPVTRRFIDRRSHLPGRPRLEPSDYEGFERHAIFHDVFLSGAELRAIGPPLGNLARVIRPIRCRVLHPNGACSPPLAHRVATRDRFAFHRFRLPRELAEADALCLSVELATGQRAELEVCRQRLEPVFLQLVTMQKDSPFEWIADWLRYAAAVLGVERVILYDNGSADFATLPARIGALDDVPEVLLVDWPYAYGPVRSFYNQFSQPSQNNHAHQCFGGAEWTGHFDVDEYLVAGDALSLPERLRRLSPRTGVLRVDSYWMPRLAGAPATPEAPPAAERGAPRRAADAVDEGPAGAAADLASVCAEGAALRVPTVRDFRWREREPRGRSYKYLARERALAEAKVHNGRLRLGWIRRYPDPADLAFLHYVPLSTGWKTYWDRQAPEPHDPARHVGERRVLEAMVALDGARGSARGERLSGGAEKAEDEQDDHHRAERDEDTP